MISIIKSLIEDFISIPSFNLIILGPQQTGKTRFFNLIKNFYNIDSSTNSQTVYTPTVGLNTTKFKANEIRLCIWDLGGKKSIRKIWQNYYPQSHGIVYFVNDKNEQCLEQSFQVLRQTLKHNEMARIPILLLVKNNSSQQKVQRFVEREPEIFNREYKIQIFEFEQVGVLSDPTESIKRQQQAFQLKKNPYSIATQMALCQMFSPRQRGKELWTELMMIQFKEFIDQVKF